MYKGELLSLVVAVSWTVTALTAEVATKRIGSLAVNVIRMTLSLVFLAVTMWVVMGVPYPRFADEGTWLWLSLSGFVGYVLGDFCLFNSYILIGSRFGQLFMTLAPPSAAIASWMIFGDVMTPLSIIGMFVTIAGIGMSILSKGQKPDDADSKRRVKLSTNLPLKGILYGIGAGMGQGIGLVLSKLGMKYYEASIQSNCDMLALPADSSMLDDTMSMVPFSSTFIRAITGLVGFVVLMLVSRRTRQVVTSVRDRKAMLFMLVATICGPFVGVSLSLMATLYTNAGIAQTIMALTPILILWPTWFFFKQKVTVREIVGAVISVIGVSLFFV